VYSRVHFIARHNPFVILQAPRFSEQLFDSRRMSLLHLPLRSIERIAVSLARMAA
jgi:hypothetical protein